MIGQKATGSSLRGAEGHSRGTRRAVVTVLNDFEPGRFGNELFFVTAKFEGKISLSSFCCAHNFDNGFYIQFCTFHKQYSMLPMFDMLLELLVSYSISVAYYFYVF